MAALSNYSHCEFELQRLQATGSSEKGKTLVTQRQLMQQTVVNDLI
jgi:hypothetical protein